MVEMPDEIVHISIFDMMGRPIVTIEHSTVKNPSETRYVCNPCLLSKLVKIIQGV
jgi:hypothetical protein